MPQPLLGIVDGKFQKLVPGVKFTGQDFPAGPAVMEQLRAGTIDIAYTGPYPPIKGFAKSKDVVLLAGAAKGGTALSVAKNSPVKSVKDLKGKVVGVNQLGSTVDAMVRNQLLLAGLTPGKDVRLIEVKPADQASALSDKKQEIAAVAAAAPWPSVAALKGYGRPLLDAKAMLDNGNYLSAVVFTTKKFADQNPELLAKFVAAHRKITDELNADRAKGDARVLAAWSKVTKKTLDPAVSKAAFATIEFTNQADVKSLQRDLDIAVKTGIAKQKSDLAGFVWEPKQ
jgi:NitT/TauT family transport system substrate-binding protein